MTAVHYSAMGNSTLAVHSPYTMIFRPKVAEGRGVGPLEPIKTHHLSRMAASPIAALPGFTNGRNGSFAAVGSLLRNG